MQLFENQGVYNLMQIRYCAYCLIEMRVDGLKIFINPCFAIGQREIDGAITDFIYPSNLFSHPQFAMVIT